MGGTKGGREGGREVEKETPCSSQISLTTNKTKSMKYLTRYPTLMTISHMYYLGMEIEDH